MSGARTSRPGLAAVETIGHTPGHTSYVLSSGSDKVFIQSDVTNLPALFVDQSGLAPDVRPGSGVAETTRRKVYDMLVADKMRVQGFHYPFPAIGSCREGWQRLPAGAGAVESGDLNRPLPYIDQRPPVRAAFVFWLDREGARPYSPRP